MKQIKILGVLAIALTLGLAACGGTPGGDNSHASDQSSKHTHSWGDWT